jgi:hypothetical protein
LRQVWLAGRRHGGAACKQAKLDAKPHRAWRELCTLATAGNFVPAETEQLRRHLADRAEYRATLAEYRSLLREGVPLVAMTMLAPGARRTTEVSC